jgi:hypothetical protein
MFMPDAFPICPTDGVPMDGENVDADVRHGAVLDMTLAKTQQVASEVQRASEDLMVVNVVLEQEVPEEAQVGDLAQAIAHTSDLEKKLAQSAETLTQVNAALAREIEKRAEVTRRLAESEALVEALTGPDDTAGKAAS